MNGVSDKQLYVSSTTQRDVDITCAGGDRHPQFCAELGVFPDTAIKRSNVLYQWDLAPGRYEEMTPAQRQRMEDFLAAHGISPHRFMEGNYLAVRVRCDGSLWLYTWRMVEPGPGEDCAPRCPHCPNCVKQEEVVTPLVAPIPASCGGYIADYVTVPAA